MRTARPNLVALVLPTVMLVAGGCSTSPPSRFYVLTPLASSGPTAPEPGVVQTPIRIAAVGLPKHLDRPQIVTRGEGNRLLFGEFDRWGEPLEHNFASVLAENLTRLLASQGVTVLTFRQGVSVDYEVWVELTRFDVDTDGKASLHAMWQVQRAGSSEGKLYTSRLEEHSDGEEYEARVEALSRAVRALSGEIADAVKDTLAKPSAQ